MRRERAPAARGLQDVGTALWPESRGESAREHGGGQAGTADSHGEGRGGEGEGEGTQVTPSLFRFGGFVCFVLPFTQ